MGRCYGAGSCVRVVTCVILVCFAGLMLSIGIAWHVIEPHEPGFRVRSLSVSNFSVSDSELEGKYDVGLTIRNPNKKVQASLDRFKLWVCYDEAQLAEGGVEPIHLDLEKMGEKDVVGSGWSSGSGWGEVVGDLGKEWRKEVVKLNVKIQVGVKYEYGILPSRERVLHVYCGDLRVFFSAKSKHTGKLLSVGGGCHATSIS
ncbi:hypothetical protein L6164_022158 [Bauhinia variegata]|uniref:Uncharacterized protein n=1 Tax=Bauhinia variegata TaxID=167791 RepID=A0ACB9MFP3_BAUVA|nr:hypothetical protein L6164_022158 [Bauhinia variegata]